MNTETNYASLYYADLSMDAEAIEENVRNYPASSVARFLRLVHLKKTNDPRFEEEAKQTGLYLNNPYWMEFQLSRWDREPEIHDDVRVNLPGGEVENNEIEILIETNQSFDNDLFVNEDQNKLSDEISAPDMPGVEESQTEDEEMTLQANEPVSGGGIPENEIAESWIEEVVIEREASVESEMTDQVVEPISENRDLAPPLNEPISEHVIWENEAAQSPIEDMVPEPEANLESEMPDKVAGLLSENRDLAPPVTGQFTENIISEDEVAAQQDEKIGEPVTPLDEPQNEVSGESETNFNKEESVFNVKAPDFEEESSVEATFNSATNNEEENEFEIPFEPLHTVDYFASQGIRLTEEALNDDQLGKQVKSFTAWLKSMKKLHPGQLPEQNEVIEKLIQTSSEVSNKSANVLTEAMAEVLLKQGKSQKAIEMYEKLSLLNPSKSAYFAAKIESLKII